MPIASLAPAQTPARSPDHATVATSPGAHPRLSRAAWRATLAPDACAQLDRLADNLKAVRARRRFSQRALAKVSGVNASHIAMIERGLENATVLTLLRLAQALRTTPAALLTAPRLER